MTLSGSETTRNPVPIRFSLLTARLNEKVAPFDCGNQMITQWLHQDALRQTIAGNYAAYVAVELETGNEIVVGYVAVRADFIQYPPQKAEERIIESFLSWRLPTWGVTESGNVEISAFD